MLRLFTLLNLFLIGSAFLSQFSFADDLILPKPPGEFPAELDQLASTRPVPYTAELVLPSELAKLAKMAAEPEWTETRLARFGTVLSQHIVSSHSLTKFARVKPEVMRDALAETRAKWKVGGLEILLAATPISERCPNISLILARLYYAYGLMIGGVIRGEETVAVKEPSLETTYKKYLGLLNENNPKDKSQANTKDGYFEDLKTAFRIAMANRITAELKECLGAHDKPSP